MAWYRKSHKHATSQGTKTHMHLDSDSQLKRDEEGPRKKDDQGKIEIKSWHVFMQASVWLEAATQLVVLEKEWKALKKIEDH